MIFFPKHFVETMFPGYVWDTVNKELYSFKSGQLKKMKIQYPNRWNLIPQKGYIVSHQGKRRYMNLDYLHALKSNDSSVQIFGKAPELLDVFSRAITLSKREGPDPFKRLAKLVEEVGELSEAMLGEGKHQHSEYKKKSTCDIKEEIADCLIVISSLVESYDFSLAEVAQSINTKCDKWESLLNQKKIAN